MDVFAEFMLRDFSFFGYGIQYWLLGVVVFFILWILYLIVTRPFDG
jgi:hypothetical protein